MNKIVSFFISPPVYIAVSRKRGGFLSGGILFLRHVDLIVFALRLASAKKFLSGFCTCTILFRSSAFFFNFAIIVKFPRGVIFAFFCIRLSVLFGDLAERKIA